jgi:hypothetical protein
MRHVFCPAASKVHAVRVWARRAAWPSPIPGARTQLLRGTEGSARATRTSTALCLLSRRHEPCTLPDRRQQQMKTNVVLAERSLRVGLGLLLLATPLLELHTFPLNLLGIVLLVTGALGYCPLYGVFRSNKAKGLKLVPPTEARNDAVPAHHRAH